MRPPSDICSKAYRITHHIYASINTAFFEVNGRRKAHRPVPGAWPAPERAPTASDDRPQARPRVGSAAPYTDQVLRTPPGAAPLPRADRRTEPRGSRSGCVVCNQL